MQYWLSKVNMKKLAMVAFLLMLTACSSTSTPKASTTPTAAPTITKTYSAPTDCTTTKILAALPTDIPNPKFINTPWQPAAGTELADVLNNAGIACSYGNQSAAIGATILWVNDKGMYDKRITDWGQKGYVKVDLPNLDESSAYLLFKPVSATQEFHIWILNFLFHGVWIQVNATYVNDLNQAAPLINAALASLTS